MEVTARSLSLAHKHLKRIQTQMRAWFSGYYGAPRGVRSPGLALGGRGGGLRKTPPHSGPGFLLVKTLGLWIYSSPAPMESDSSNSIMQCFPDFF